MIAKEEISLVRQQVDKYIGSKVLIKANKGRKRVVIKEGVLQSTYPSIFIVKVQNEYQDTYRTVSYSYTDIITNNVELSLYPE
ncbi:MAG: hypothetical protein CVV02_00245 [Firmicutes bacterium HGW-Firmicutes-7]|nr:MAG: hypothetical protein CVV02_00245 [Firmicutes bacterium HGW-Firmicutes-7]